ncbi:MAG: DHH family phosphoesterase [Cytophagales bacterium]|nr:DHH family phosphoesterase [Armatimonadota bacterium]
MPNSSDRTDTWDPAYTYVIGHQRPDTDSIAAALGYAWLLTETGHKNILAARAGQPGEQAIFALNRFEQALPRLLSGVAPTFAHVVKDCESVLPEAPLSEALARIAAGEQVVPVVDAERKPTGVVTPLGLARAYARSLSLSPSRGKGDDLSLVPLLPLCREVAEPALMFKERERISDHRSGLLRADSHQFMVTTTEGRYMGMATQRDLLQPPRARLILVDHNELTQAVVGADEADIVGVLDHHRLGNPPTASPIPFVVDPVGSTSTLVAEQCESHGKMPSAGLAGLLLSGILSDTLVFRSPTTSERDKAVAKWLSQICRVDMQKYGTDLLRSAPSLGSRTAGEILDTDRKSYEMGGVSVSISQVEVTGMQELPQRKVELYKAMDDRLFRENLALLCLMITDVVTGRSVMLARGDNNLTDSLPFSHVADYEFDLGDIVSRKKQLVPALYNVFESSG